MPESVIIAGAGHAAGQVVASLKQKKFAGRITLIGEEAYLPYQRPPLSKKFLAGELDESRLLFKPADFYRDDNIEVQLNTVVTAIDPAAHAITTNDQAELAYDKLVLALGARPRVLDVPGAELAGVNMLRNIDDVRGLRNFVASGKRIVIIGAGYIGLEVAAVCRQLGLQVTVVEMADRVMSRVVAEPVSRFYQQLHEQHGVEFRLGTGLKALQGDSQVRAVAVDDGSVLPADLVVIGAGVLPNVELAAAAGLSVDNGIVVDAACRSSNADIFAVGDCTAHPSFVYDRQLRLESVHNALEQAKTAAANICGEASQYSQVPWFWSDQYDLKLQIAGLSTDYDAIVMRGDPAARKFACFYLRDAVLIAVDAVNSPKEFMQSKRLIEAQARPDPALLADVTGDLATAL